MAEWTEEQMRLLSEVLPQVAGQLRIPLGNLGLAAQQLTPGEDDERGRRAAAVLQQSYYRILRVVNNMAFSPHLVEEERFARENVDVPAWLEELCLQAEGLFREKGVALAWKLDAAHHVAAIHPDYLERLVWNLLSNALKFTPEGGAVSVSLRRAGGKLLLTVTDSGCGIPQDMMETVFDRWLHTERMDPLPHGLGLGLPLCRAVAEGHGGQLLLDSREGRGTSVTAALPDETVEGDKLHSGRTDYAGGFSRALLELSDALPSGAFTPWEVQ